MVISLYFEWLSVRRRIERYPFSRALSNIMDCDEYDIQEALVLNKDNLSVDGRITYLPVYMVMFLDKGAAAPIEYKVDLGGLSNGDV